MVWQKTFGLLKKTCNHKHKNMKISFKNQLPMMKITFSWQRILLLALLFFTTVSISSGQVKVGDNPTSIDASAAFEIESTTKGFLPPRMTKTQMDAIVNPHEGLIVYCTDCSPKGTYQFDGAEWQPLIAGGNPNVSINCSVDGFTGSLVEGQAITTQTFSVTVTNSSFSTAGVSFNTSDLTFSGIAGITVTGVSPASTTLNTAGDQAKVTYTLSGTPTSFGTLTADIDIAGILTCSANTTVISASDNILAQIGNEADDPDVINSVVTVAQLNLITPALTGVTAGNETAYQNYIDANPNDFSSPATQAEVQAMVTQVNTNQTLLANIGIDAGNGNNANTSTLTATELNAIVGVSGATAGNEAAYRAAIAANEGPFSSPATEAEVQAMVTQINTNQTLLANIGIDAGNGNNANTSTLTATELNAIVGVSGATAGNEAAYRAAIAANEGPFSSPATEAEVQAMVTAVNTSQTVLAKIGNEADDPDVVTSVVTVAELNTIIPALTGVNASFEAAYQNYIDANPNDFSSPATQPEVQAMINYVAANPPIPAAITLGTGESYTVASIYDQDYLPYVTPTGPAVTTAVAADGTSESTTIDVQGSITTTGITISIPVTASGSGTLPAYSSTITIPSNLTEDGIARDLTLSWASQAFTAGTTSITATLAAVGGTLNAKKLDLNGGIGNNNLGVLMGTFNYPINNAGTTTAFEVRITPGIPDRAFGDGVHDFIYLPVTNLTTGETWLNNNLGASYANVNHPDFNPLQQATSSTDNKAYGSIYQWGRYSDGHEFVKRNAGDPHSTSGITALNATVSTDNPPHDDFIIVSDSHPKDWRVPQNNNLWQGVNGINNPCPTGYRIPTTTELNAERLSWNSNNSTGAFASPLKFTVPGYRTINTGVLDQVGSNGYYRSSTLLGADSELLSFNGSSAAIDVRGRADGTSSIRCIKD
jgi:hypothetical protein